MDVGQAQSGISVDEWRAELERIFANAVDGVSSTEIATLTNKSQNWANDWIIKEIRAGRVVFAGKKPGLGIIGQKIMIPVYRKVK